MTEYSGYKKRVRAYAAQYGLTYTQALREFYELDHEHEDEYADGE